MFPAEVPESNLTAQGGCCQQFPPFLLPSYLSNPSVSTTDLKFSKADLFGHLHFQTQIQCAL